MFFGKLNKPVVSKLMPKENVNLDSDRDSVMDFVLETITSPSHCIRQPDLVWFEDCLNPIGPTGRSIQATLDNGLNGGEGLNCTN